MPFELPRRFHIGTQKAGSSFLYNVLLQHPSISLGCNSEVQFFTKHFDKGIAWYKEAFRGQGNTVDITPKYFMSGEIVAPRIKEFVGDKDPRFVIILRNPIDYVNSHFQLQKLGGFFTLHKDRYPDFTPELIPFIKRYPAYVERGLYHKIFSTYWLSQFDRSQFLVFFFEEFIKQKQEVFDDILSFWGLPPHVFDFSQISKNPMLKNSFLYKMKRGVVKRSWLKKKLKHSKVFQHIYLNHLTSSSAELLAPEDRAYLKNIFAEDVGRLGGLLGKDMSVWKDFT